MDYGALLGLRGYAYVSTVRNLLFALLSFVRSLSLHEAQRCGLPRREHPERGGTGPCRLSPSSRGCCPGSFLTSHEPDDLIYSPRLYFRLRDRKLPERLHCSAPRRQVYRPPPFRMSPLWHAHRLVRQRSADQLYPPQTSMQELFAAHLVAVPLRRASFRRPGRPPDLAVRTVRPALSFTTPSLRRSSSSPLSTSITRSFPTRSRCPAS